MDVHGRTDSAVLAPLYLDEAGALHAVFTRRRADLSRHAGEISFPGGRRDEGETLIETALREAHEEIGLPPDAVDLLGALEPTPTFVTNYAIYPFVGLIEPGFEWVIGEAEEEIGLPARAVELVGALQPTPTIATNYAVYPFVGLIEPGHPWRPSAQEVAEVLELPLDTLRSAYAERRLVRRGIPFRTPTYEVDGHLIWGATGRILQDLLARI